MSHQRLSTLVYDDLACYTMEQIDLVRRTKGYELDERCRNEIKRLTDVGFVSYESSSGHSLTKKGEHHLLGAITCAREENYSALKYTGIIIGFSIAFFGLLVGSFQGQNQYALLLTYLLCFLFGSILASFFAGFCFWHGCSCEHGWEELRTLNEMGDSWIVFSGWILLYAVYLVLFLNFSKTNFTIDISFLKQSVPFLGVPIYILIYFLTPTCVLMVWMFFSWRAYKGDTVRPIGIRNVVYDFVNTSTFIFPGCKRFFETDKPGPRRGWLILIMLSITFSAPPIVLLTLPI